MSGNADDAAAAAAGSGNQPAPAAGSGNETAPAERRGSRPGPERRPAMIGLLVGVVAVLALAAWLVRHRSAEPAATRTVPPTAQDVRGATAGQASTDGEGPAAESAGGSRSDTCPVDNPNCVDPLGYLTTHPPERDLVDLAVRLGGLAPSAIPAGWAGSGEASATSAWDREPEVGAGVPEAPLAPACVVGQRAPFWVHDIQGQSYFEIEAVVRVVTDHACVWVQDGRRFDQAALERGAGTFSDEIVPALRRVFGSETSPGIDGDPRIHLLHHESIDGVAGFFSSSDAVPAAVNRYSNQRELFYISMDDHRPGSYDYLALLAHEYQHMIQYNVDRNEDGWVNEGFSAVAPHLVGYGSQTATEFFLAPDTALLEWDPGMANAPHYAASYAFFSYLRARFGDRSISAVSASPHGGAAGVIDGLRELGYGGSFEELFQDWLVANVLDSLAHGGSTDPRYDYGSVLDGGVVPEPLPADGLVDGVGQYAADYLDVTALVQDAQLALDFAGEAGVGLLGSAPDDHVSVWWSGWGDSSNSRLTLVLDPAALGGLPDRLAFDLWYELEESWDWGYVSLSADRGRTWRRLPLEGSAETDPNGTGFGGGVTGRSPGWTSQSVPLAEPAGAADPAGRATGPLLVRFETVTDDTVSLTGMALAEVRLIASDRALPEVPPEAAWEPEGWVSLDPKLPQRWSLQLVETRPSGVRVLPFAVAADGSASIRLDDVPSDAALTLVVGATTPGTRNPAIYRLLPGSRSGQ